MSNNAFNPADYFENYMYEKITAQINRDCHLHWGKDKHTVILSDRCLGRAAGLKEYLTKLSDLSSIEYFKTYNEIKNHLHAFTPDILIFVGMQEQVSNYRIGTELLKMNPYALVIMYASFDETIQYECLNHSINYIFNSWNPVSEFIAFMQSLLHANKQFYRLS